MHIDRPDKYEYMLGRAFDLLCFILDFPVERPQNYHLAVFSLLVDDITQQSESRQMLVSQQAENRQMLVLRPF